MKAKLTVSIIGSGRVGGALAIALSKKGFEIIALVSQNRENAKKISDLLKTKPLALSADELSQLPKSNIFIISTPDGEINKTAEKLANQTSLWANSPSVLHTSGALSSEILTPLREKKCFVGSMHPLVSISDPKLGSKRFKDVFFCLEGDADARKSAQKIVKILDGKSFSIDGKFKTLYHAAAVMACGHIVALFDAANETLANCGLSENQAKKILLPLVESTFQNLASQTNAESLTGTFARADLETMKNHLQSFKENSAPEILEIYQILGLRSIELAKRQGANGKQLDEMRKLLGSGQ